MQGMENQRLIQKNAENTEEEILTDNYVFFSQKYQKWNVFIIQSSLKVNVDSYLRIGRFLKEMDRTVPVNVINLIVLLYWDIVSRIHALVISFHQY